MYTYSSVTSPKFINEQTTRIMCLVKFDKFKETIQFIATADDCEEHGKQIFDECMAGNYGPIAAYEPPPVEPAPEAPVV